MRFVNYKSTLELDQVYCLPHIQSYNFMPHSCQCKTPTRPTIGVKIQFLVTILNVTGPKKAANGSNLYYFGCS